MSTRLKTKFGAATLVLALSLFAGAVGSFGADPAKGPLPIVFWTSDPVWPGDLVLGYGAGLSGAENIRVVRLADGPRGGPGREGFVPRGSVRSVGPLQSSDHSVKFVLPENLKPGVFGVQLETPKGRTAVVWLNRPDVWWCQGDRGQAASPGGWVRVFGRCLGWSGRAITTVFLRGARGVAISAKADCYSARAELPKHLPAGDYEVFVHNGFGGKWGWSRPLKISVVRPEAWSNTIFNVRKLGAKGDGESDDTAVVGEALRKAKEEGGGSRLLSPWRLQVSCRTRSAA